MPCKPAHKRGSARPSDEVRQLLPTSPNCGARRSKVGRAATSALLCTLAGASLLLGSVNVGAQTTTQTPSTTTTLSGAGSTFDEPFFSLAFPAYHRLNRSVAVNYAAVGSSDGIQDFQGNKVDFGASDVPMTSAEQAASQGGPTVQVPVDLGAEVVAYNLLGVGSGLRLTGPIIADIFRGKITNWDAPAIRALNPNINIPNLGIIVVHRSDGSGTTYIFSDYLAAVSSAWSSSLGVGRSINWPVGLGGDGNAGVASIVAHTTGAIGYVERSYTSDTLLGFAAIRNRAGRYVTPFAANIATAAAQKPDVSAKDFSIVDQPGALAYPIVGYSWALLYKNQSDSRSGHALVQLLDWLTHSGQSYAAQAGYVPLPSNIRALARSALSQVVSSSGKSLLAS